MKSCRFKKKLIENWSGIKIIWKLKFWKLILKEIGVLKIGVLKIKFKNWSFGKLFENRNYENWNFEELYENVIS